MRIPPPLQPLPGGDVVGRRFVLYDHTVRGEIHGTLVETRPGASPVWRVRLDEGPLPGADVWLRSDGCSHLDRWRVVRPADHPVDVLFAKLGRVAPYPAGVAPVPARIVGTAFFPGGSGLWRPDVRGELPRFPVGGAMILGHDFHSVVQYERSLAHGGERLKAPTWDGLLSLLASVSLAAERCFFTNAYMGLRTGASSVGAHPVARDAGFVARCEAFLLKQLAAQRPKVIVVLGLPAARMLAALAPDALRAWSAARGIRALDEAGAALAHDVPFPEAGEVIADAVVVVHPSYRRLNVERRRYRRGNGELRGVAAERALLQDAMRALDGSPT